MAWPATVFDTEHWADAWSRSTIERIKEIDDVGEPVYLVDYSPFWQGYETDTGLPPVWDRPLATIGSLYAFYGPAHLAAHPDRVADVVDRGLERARSWDASGLLVANLPQDAAEEWAAVRPPDVKARLDLEYFRRIGEGRDPVVGDVTPHVRTEWRRRWRRATERGVRLVEEHDPPGEHLDEVVALTNESAQNHDWPLVYDRTTVEEVVGMPEGRLVRADLDGRTVGTFVTLEHDRRVYLWAGGVDHSMLKEVSPYLFMLYELLGMGEERGWDVLEFGRGNDTFKRRYGFEGIELWSLWYATGPEDAEVYGPRLSALHDGLARCMGL